MKRIIISILGVLTIFSIVSCDKNNGINKSSLEKVVFSAGLDDMATKTQLVDGKKVHWTDGDKVAVFDDKNLKNVPFNATNINGATADFEGTLATEGVTSYVAVYPWTSSLRYNKAKYETTIPHYQKAVKGSFDTGLNLAAATTTSESMHLSFKNLCALVKVTIPSNITDITALTLMSDEFLTGRVLFTFDAKGNPVMDKESSTGYGFKEVTLAEENGQPLAPGDYYFVIRPSSSSILAEGEGGVQHSFTVGATTVSGRVASIKSNTKVTVNANDVVNLGTLSLSKASKFRVTNAPVGDFPIGVEKFKIEYEGNDGATVKFSNRNSNIAKADADGVVSFEGTVGVAHIFAVCNNVNYPLVFNITKGYYAENLESEAGSKWNIAASHISSGAKQEFVTASDGNYIKCTPYIFKNSSGIYQGRADLQRSGTTYLTREYPIICVRVDDVNDKGYARNININAVGKTETGTEFKGNIGGDNNKWQYKYECSDGSALLVYDLSKQGFGKSDGTNLLPVGQVGDFTTFQLKYADIKQGTALSMTAEDIAYRFFWFRTFANTDALNAYLETWSKETGITYTQTK